MIIQLFAGLLAIVLFVYIFEHWLPQWFRRFVSLFPGMFFMFVLSFYLVLLFLFGWYMAIGALVYFGFMGLYYIPMVCYTQGARIVSDGQLLVVLKGIWNKAVAGYQSLLNRSSKQVEV